MDVFTAVPGTILELGKTGTNKTRAWRFPVKSWMEEYPDGLVSVLHKRPGDDTAAPVSLSEIDGEYIYWTVSSADVATAGNGLCVLVLTDTGGVVAKTMTYDTHITEALGGTGTTPPDPQAGWVDQVLDAAQDVLDAAAEVAGYAEGLMGAARVYVGEDEPEDENFDVWIDPNGGPNVTEANGVSF